MSAHMVPCYPFVMELFKLAARIILSCATGVLTFLGTMTASCIDIGGVPSWERCSSSLRNPIIEWPGGNLSLLFPLGLGIGVGYLVWWLLGKAPHSASP